MRRAGSSTVASEGLAFRGDKALAFLYGSTHVRLCRRYIKGPIAKS